MWRHTYALCNFLLKQTRWTRHEQNATIRNSQTLAGHRLRILITQPESKVLQDHVPLQQHSIGQIQRKGPSKIPLKMSPYTQGAESLRARSLRTFPRQKKCSPISSFQGELQLYFICHHPGIGQLFGGSPSPSFIWEGSVEPSFNGLLFIADSFLGFVSKRSPDPQNQLVSISVSRKSNHGKGNCVES